MPRLVLTRRPAEELIFDLPSGEAIAIYLVDIRGNKVRLSIEAPAEVKVLRRELKERLKAAS